MVATRFRQMLVAWKQRLRERARRVVPASILEELSRAYLLDAQTRAAYLRLLVWRSRRSSRSLRELRNLLPRKILFVCHGNIMRSALAEALLAARLADMPESSIEIESAGTHALNGQSADPRMRAAALALGVSLESHRSTTLSEALVANADVIFVMDYLNEAVLRSRFPKAWPKVRLLGAYMSDNGHGAEIPDPFSSDDDATDRCAAHIDACVSRLQSVLAARHALEARVLRR